MLDEIIAFFLIILAFCAVVIGIFGSAMYSDYETARENCRLLEEGGNDVKVVHAQVMLIHDWDCMVKASNGKYVFQEQFWVEGTR